jgi:hypothetical protein
MSRSLPWVAFFLSLIAIDCTPARTPLGFSAEAPSGLCQVPCDRRWVVLPEQCQAGSRPVPPAANPSRGGISGMVVTYPFIFSKDHDFSQDTSPARDVVVTVSTRPIIEILNEKTPPVPAQSAVSDPAGRYVILDLVPGSYHVLAVRHCGGGGSNNFQEADVVVEAGRMAVADFKFGEDTHF